MKADVIKVLLVDDDQADYEMTRALLSAIERETIELDWVRSYEEGLEALERAEHDVYLLDYFLEDRTGLDLLRDARDRGVRAPVIMLTGRGSLDVDLKAMKGGAADYLVKGRIDPDALERSIRYALERQRAEETLRDSEERHRGMFDHLPIGLYRVSPDGDFMDANPALVRILGHPDAEALRTAYSANFYVGEDDRARFRQLMEEEGVVRGFETKLRRNDGSLIRVRNTARAHRGPDGAVRYLEGAVEDVTDLARAEGLAGSEARLRSVMDASRSGIAILDLEKRVLEANSAFRQILGYGPEEIKGMAFRELVLGEDVPGAEENLERLRSGGAEDVSGERRLLRRDGAVVWARAVGKLIRDPDGEPEEIILLLEDVAETVQVPHQMD